MGLHGEEFWGKWSLGFLKMVRRLLIAYVILLNTMHLEEDYFLGTDHKVSTSRGLHVVSSGGLKGGFKGCGI